MKNFFDIQYENLKKEIASYEEKRLDDISRFDKFKSVDPQVDKARAQEYAQSRVDKIKINILQETLALELAEIINLPNEEQAIYVTSKEESVGINVIGTQGGAPLKQWTGDQQFTIVPSYWVQSDKYYYPIESPSFGAFSNSEDLTARAAHDMAVKIDDDLWTLVAAGLGVFPARAMELDSNIVSSLVPSSNEVDSSSEGAITKNLFIEIFDHFDRLGRRVKKIYIPADYKKQIRTWVSVVSGIAGSDITKTIDPVTQREIWQSGSLSAMFGENFQIIPMMTNTGSIFINGGDRYVLVATDKPAVKLYRKPGQAKSWLLTDKEVDNRTGFSSRETMGTAQPEPLRLNYARFQFI